MFSRNNFKNGLTFVQIKSFNESVSKQRALLPEVFVPRVGQSFIYNSLTSSDIMVATTATPAVGGQQPKQISTRSLLALC